MTSLSHRQAANCEQALESRCRCRCGGVLHGAKRISADDRAAFEQLPVDDPHRVDARPAPRTLTLFNPLQISNARMKFFLGESHR